MNGIPTTANNNIPHLTSYGNTLITADNKALLRGSGLYNPGPNYDQTVDRGPAYSQALNFYSTFDPQSATNFNAMGNFAKPNYYNTDKATQAANFANVSKDWENVQSNLDQDNILKYKVGSTGFHPEREGSWDRESYQCSTGSDQYQTWAMKSMNITPSALLNFFFSEDNVKYLQNQMTREVKRIRNEDISPQSIDDLLIIMRNKYEYALSGFLPYAGDPNKVRARGTVENPGGLAYDANAGGCTSLEEQIQRLNKSIVEETVSQILSGIDQYKQYYKDASSIPIPLSHPVHISTKGANVLQPNLGFQSGHEMSKSISSYSQRFNII
jgi:hypothetical protein